MRSVPRPSYPSGILASSAPEDAHAFARRNHMHMSCQLHRHPGILKQSYRPRFSSRAPTRSARACTSPTCVPLPHPFSVMCGADADTQMMAQPADYCCAHLNDSASVLLLCEVVVVLFYGYGPVGDAPGVRLQHPQMRELRSLQYDHVQHQALSHLWVPSRWLCTAPSPFVQWNTELCLQPCKCDGGERCRYVKERGGGREDVKGRRLMYVILREPRPPSHRLPKLT